MGDCLLKIKVKVVWVSDIFLHLIRPSCVNGVGASSKKERLFGSKLLVGSLE